MGEVNIKCIRLADFKKKEVINSCNCERLGFVCDVEFNQQTGCISAIVVPASYKICGFICRETEYVIPWNCISCVGPDIIMVNIEKSNVIRKCSKTVL